MKKREKQETRRKQKERQEGRKKDKRKRETEKEKQKKGEAKKRLREKERETEKINKKCPFLGGKDRAFCLLEAKKGKEKKTKTKPNNKEIRRV